MARTGLRAHAPCPGRRPPRAHTLRSQSDILRPVTLPALVDPLLQTLPLALPREQAPRVTCCRAKWAEARGPCRGLAAALTPRPALRPVAGCGGSQLRGRRAQRLTGVPCPTGLHPFSPAGAPRSGVLVDAHTRSGCPGARLTSDRCRRTVRVGRCPLATGLAQPLPSALCVSRKGGCGRGY